VFSGTPPKHSVPGIWTIRPDGSDLRRVTRPHPRYRQDRHPDWSPDGRHIVFLRCACFSGGRSPDPSPLMFVRPDGSGLHGNGEIDVNGAAYRYAPSGDLLVSHAFDTEPDPTCGDIFTIPVVGGTRTK
jgi:hypothetical protein